MVNIRDVAKKAQLSPGTISRVLNKDPNLSVNEKTREKIYAICTELNYTPRQYKTKNKKKSIGIISAVSRKNEIDDLYYRQIRESLVQTSKSLNLCVDFMIFLPNLEQSIDRIKNVDCIIVIGHVQKDIHSQIAKINSRLIIVDDFYCSSEYSSVSVDFYREMINILDYIYDLGHRNIAFIAGKNQRITLTNDYIPDGLGDREQAYTDWMKKKQLSTYNYSYIGDEWFAQSGYNLTNQIIETRKTLPTVIVAASDMMSIGILRRLSESNIKVPEDISLCSFDDLEMCSFLTPSLSTLHIDIDEMVYWTLQLCKNLINKKDTQPIKIVLSGKLIVRESLRSISD
ncbi:LacI family DNA-binding transcriptional regulator [Enterococcus massiliensis]|uniref:LacI family DNA-binding transcriptional regulator n=1 Tax=Enterococcus massiliensis TaxID=1640685 RepID=UPI00065E195A|nr:LacI family DNA-binding transcriptional regulator [Enterococcus massiliensis]